MTDVLIAGGGIAGSALAILLGRQGVRVEIFERARFPREKPCGEGLMPAGVAALERMALREEAGGAPFHGVRYHFERRSITGKFPAQNGRAATGLGQRRFVLDRVLFQTAASTPNVTAHEGVSVDGPIVEQGRVKGLHAERKELRAALVVAADGVHSSLRRQLGLAQPIRRKRFGVRTHFRLAHGREHPSWVDVFLGARHELYVTPLPEGEILVGALVHAVALNEPVAEAFPRWCRAQPALAEELEGAAQLTPLHGVSPLAARPRAGFVPGCVLLGDAAGFVDPITGGGMAQALLSAELLAGHAVENLGREDVWLREFDRAREKMLRDYRWLTGMLLWLSERPRLARRTLGVMPRFPRLLSHLVGVATGMRNFFDLSAVS